MYRKSTKSKTHQVRRVQNKAPAQKMFIKSKQKAFKRKNANVLVIALSLNPLNRRCKNDKDDHDSNDSLPIITTDIHAHSDHKSNQNI